MFRISKIHVEKKKATKKQTTFKKAFFAKGIELIFETRTDENVNWYGEEKKNHQHEIFKLLPFSI